MSYDSWYKGVNTIYYYLNDTVFGDIIHIYKLHLQVRIAASGIIPTSSSAIDNNNISLLNITGLYHFVWGSKQCMEPLDTEVWKT